MLKAFRLAATTTLGIIAIGLAAPTTHALSGAQSLAPPATIVLAQRNNDEVTPLRMGSAGTKRCLDSCGRTAQRCYSKASGRRAKETCEAQGVNCKNRCR